MSLTFSQVGFEYDAGTSYAAPALADVDLDIVPRGLTLVLGATGSGKSTLLRLAAGLLLPTAGRVEYHGRLVTGPLAAGERAVGLVFQSPEAQLFAETVELDVAFGPRNQGRTESDARTAARAALVAVGLDPAQFAARSPFSLSGGEARRAAIAGVLAMEPGYLLFDEPTAGLDASGRIAVREIVAEAKAGSGVVVVTHDAEEFLGMADRIVLLAQGRITFDGAVDELLAAPDHFVRAELRVPEVLRTQMLAVEAGLALERYSADPVEAAESIARARGVER